ncbi:hypothetical protein ABT168_08855 [Streptomyces sp. NPDC001793]|uniref:hypothetical protein n=1 Tax=Streptomyces sp. NPDC001793 TaxID=3154657 RepID=UPI00332C0FCF
MDSKNAPNTPEGKQMVPFHYVLTGQTADGQLSTVAGVVEFNVALPGATRTAGFTTAMRSLTEHMGTPPAVILHFSFERDAL